LLDSGTTRQGIPFPFGYYPPVWAGATPGEKKYVFRPEGDRVVEYFFAHNRPKGSIRVEIRGFKGAAASDTRTGKEVHFFDKETRQLLSDPPPERRQALKAVVLVDRETQIWDAGAAFCKELVRHNTTGDMLFHCKLLRVDRAKFLKNGAIKRPGG